MNFIQKIILCLLSLFIANIFAQNIENKETTLPLQFNTGNAAPYGGPSTTITIQNKKIPILFDTGAKKSELVLSEYALQGIKVEYTGKEVCFKAMDGKHCEKEFIIPKVQMGDFVMENVKGTVMPKLWGGHDDFFQETEASRNGVIGLALLSKFNVLLDYPNSKAILIKSGNQPSHYDIQNWIAIPYKNQLLTKLMLNGKLVTLTWDTGAIPSDIKLSTAQKLQQIPCPKDSPYKQVGKCSRVATNSLMTLDGKRLPNTWFEVQDMPSFVPFDGLVGSNFYANNLVYFDFDKHIIYVKPNR